MRMVVAAAIALGSSAFAGAADLKVDTAHSVFAVLTRKAGIGAGFAHDHLITAPKSTVTLSFDPAEPQATPATFATEVAKNYPVTVALHTDHCPKDALDGFVILAPISPANFADLARAIGRPEWLADPRFILKPQFYALAVGPLRLDLRHAGGEVFLNASAAAGSWS